MPEHRVLQVSPYQRFDGRNCVEFEENDGKTQRKNALAHFQIYFAEHFLPALYKYRVPKERLNNCKMKILKVSKSGVAPLMAEDYFTS
jgi:hypothetical protein